MQLTRVQEHIIFTRSHFCVTRIFIFCWRTILWLKLVAEITLYMITNAVILVPNVCIYFSWLSCLALLIELACSYNHVNCGLWKLLKFRLNFVIVAAIICTGPLKSVHATQCSLFSVLMMISSFGMTGSMRVCGSNKMEGCYMWRVYEIKTSGKVTSCFWNLYFFILLMLILTWIILMYDICISSQTCSRGMACNFIHCFRNPGGDYEWADWDKPPPKYWLKKMAALFGYPDESGHDKKTDRGSPRLFRNSRRTLTDDADRCD